MTPRPHKPRVLLLQQAVYPYRRPVFDELSRHFDLTVLFCVAAKSFRRWDTSGMFADTPFDARILPHVRLGPVVFNRGLLGELVGHRWDAVVIGTIDFVTILQVAAILAVARLRNIPVLVCEEFFPTRWYVRNRPLVGRAAIALRRLVYRRADAFVTWNRKARDFLLSCGADVDRVFDGPHFYPRPAVDERLVDPVPGKRFFLTIAYFRELKGLDVLIRAFRSLPHDVMLILAGSGELEAELRTLAEGDERIVFVGYVDGVKKQSYIRYAYGFVLPTRWDSWGLVVNEAAYHGVPVIVSDAAGCVDALVDGNGYVVPADDEEALTAAMARLLDDPDLRAEMGARSLELVDACTVAEMVRPVLQAVSVATGVSA